MRSFIKMSMTLILVLMMTSCATTKIQIPEKYSLDNQLERVKFVANVNLGKKPAFTNINESFEDPQSVMARRDTVTFSESQNQWIKVDSQSFILRATPSTYYLLVLNVPSPVLMVTDTLSFQLLANRIDAGADYLTLGGTNYMIERIYKIESSQQMLAIRNQLQKERNITK